MIFQILALGYIGNARLKENSFRYKKIIKIRIMNYKLNYLDISIKIFK